MHCVKRNKRSQNDIGNMTYFLLLRSWLRRPQIASEVLKLYKNICFILLCQTMFYWSPAVNRQPRFRGEGLVEHCWKSYEIICKSTFNLLKIVCIRTELYDLNNITEKFQPQINKNLYSQIFLNSFLRKVVFFCECDPQTIFSYWTKRLDEEIRILGEAHGTEL